MASFHGPTSLRRFARPSLLHRGFLRQINIMEVFSKARREERRRELEEDLRKGYFDDLREFRTNQGKVFQTGDRLESPGTSMPFPLVEAYDRMGERIEMSQSFFSKDASLVCVAFRNNTDAMIRSWTRPFQQYSDSGKVQTIELSCIESSFLRMNWMRGMAVRMLGSSPTTSPSSQLLLSFADTRTLCKHLGMSNKLSAYAFLVDKRGLVRWKACGQASQEDQGKLLECLTKLIK